MIAIIVVRVRNVPRNAAAMPTPIATGIETSRLLAPTSGSAMTSPKYAPTIKAIDATAIESRMYVTATPIAAPTRTPTAVAARPLIPTMSPIIGATR